VLELYLVRHSHAGNPARWDGADSARPLSERGRRQAERLGTMLEAVGFAPDAIISSPRARAMQTAEILAKALGVSVQVDERLADFVTLETLSAILADAGGKERPLVVGHDPDFSDLASQLIGTRIEMRKGALARIDLPAGPIEGGGVLRWLVPPDLLDR
jgi:phosphohistidine phosphatase